MDQQNEEKKEKENVFVEEFPRSGPVGAGVRAFLERAQAEAALTDLHLPVTAISYTTGIELHSGRFSHEPLTQRNWEQYYFDLQQSVLDDAAFVRPLAHLNEVKERAEAIVSAGSVPLAITNLLYRSAHHQLVDELSEATAGDQDVSVPPASQPLLRERRAFLVSALLPERFDFFTLLPPAYEGTRLRFVIDEQFYATNDLRPLQGLEIDFGDGQGPQTVRFGQGIEVSYPDAGEKTLQVRALYADGSLEGSFLLTLIDIATVPAPDDTWQVRATIPYLGQYGTGTAYILYGSERGQKHRSLVRPILVADGFPSHSYAQLYELLNARMFLTQVLQTGYDIVLVSYSNGSDYVQRNAFMVVECIQQIIRNKVGAVPLIVGGGSMGGVITRYALAYMEQQNLNHDTGLFFTLDAPHQGANIPLADQFQIQKLAGAGIQQANTYLTLLVSPAARQMLYYNCVMGDSITFIDQYHRSFYEELHALGYPTKCKNVGIANGSGNGRSLYFPFVHVQTLDWGGGSGFTNYAGRNWMAPVYSDEPVVVSDFDFSNVSGRTVSTLRVKDLVNYDDPPGGLRSTNGELAAAIRSQSCTRVTSNYNDHCFIPTISALDIPTVNQYLPVPAAGGTTAFDAYFVSTTNTAHVTITQEISTFLLEQLPERTFEPRSEVLEVWNDGGHAALTVYAPLKNGAGLAIKSEQTFKDAGPGATAWLAGDRQSGNQTDLFQVWNNNGRVGLTVYGPLENERAGYTISSSQTFDYAGPGAVAWFAGHKDLADKADLFQIWNNNGQCALTIYSPQVNGEPGYTISSSQTFSNAGPDAVAWLKGERQYSNITDLFQIWNNGGKVGLTVYSPQVNGEPGYTISSSQTFDNAGPGATAWLAGHRSAADRVELFQIWNNNGRVGLTIYSPVEIGPRSETDAAPGLGLAYRISSSQTFENAGPGATAWLAGLQPTTNRTELFQIWNNNGRVGLTIYAPQEGGDGSYRISSSQTFENAGPGAIAWKLLESKQQLDLVQLWNNEKQELGITVYSPDPIGGYAVSYTKFFPFHDAVAVFTVEAKQNPVGALKTQEEAE